MSDSTLCFGFSLLLIAGCSFIAQADCDAHDIEEFPVSIPARVVEVGPDDSVYGYYAHGLWRSTDQGTSWSLVKQFPDSISCGGIFVASSGTVFLGVSRYGSLWRGKPADPRSWSQPLRFHCDSCGDPSHNSTMWKMGEDSSQALYVGEYGGAWTDTCGYVYKSTDDGVHWALVYASHCRHVHFVHVDPGSDFIYASLGDGAGRQQLVRSVDGGESWAVLRDCDCLAQPTSSCFLSGRRVFGSDCGGAALNQIYTSEDDSLFTTRLVLEGESDAYVWVMSRDSCGRVYAGTVAKLPEGSAVALLGSCDGGISWCSVREFGVVPTWRGVTSLSRFDSQDWAYCSHSLSDGTYECFRFRHVPATGVVHAGSPSSLLAASVAPNPCRGEVEIRASCPGCGGPMRVRVVNARGQCVRSLTADSALGRDYMLKWDCCSDRGQAVASGVYFIELSVGSESCVEEVVVMR